MPNDERNAGQSAGRTKILDYYKAERRRVKWRPLLLRIGAAFLAVMSLPSLAFCIWEMYSNGVSWRLAMRMLTIMPAAVLFARIAIFSRPAVRSRPELIVTNEGEAA